MIGPRSRGFLQSPMVDRSALCNEDPELRRLARGLLASKEQSPGAVLALHHLKIEHQEACIVRCKK